MQRVQITINTNNLASEIAKDIENFEEKLAEAIVEEARAIIDNSAPAGRIYGRGSFIAGQSRGLNTGPGRRARGPGMRFHRASAPGQPPAKDTGKTYRQISVRRLSNQTYRLRFGGAAGYLEIGTKDMKPRKFVVPAIEQAMNRLLDNRGL